MDGHKTFKAIIARGPKGEVFAALPFEPDDAWGPKPVHHAAGRFGPCKWRGRIERIENKPVLKLNPAWRRDNDLKPGDQVTIELWAEGPQRLALDTDFAAALAAEPKAAAFFDGLATFYRKAYLTWIGSTKRNPKERVRRIAQTVKLLKAGAKSRPRPTPGPRPKPE